MIELNILEALEEKLNFVFATCDSKPMVQFENNLSDTPFVNYSIEERLSPKLSLETCKSVIVIGVPYENNLVFEEDEVLRGKFSKDSYAKDYHVVVRHILEEIARCLKQVRQLEYVIGVDTGKLYERGLAVKSGLGWQGKNCSIISSKYGSACNIGYILVDFEIEEKISLLEKGCSNCNLCEKSCPTKAITDGKCDWTKCISYLTQKKGILTEEEIYAIKNNLYGCNICTDVCPCNKPDNGKKTEVDIELIRPDLKALLKLDKKEFNEKYKDTGFFWRGYNVIKRNAIISLAFLENDPDSSMLEKYSNDENEMISDTAKKCKKILLEKRFE